MPTYIIIISTIIATLTYVLAYMWHFVGLHRRTHEVNPMSALSWTVSGVASVVFLLIAGNVMMAIIDVLSLGLGVVLLVWSVMSVRHSARHLWKITAEDFICVAITVVSVVVYKLTNDVNFGITVLFVGWVASDIPQLRKAYAAPNSDGVKWYVVSILRNIVLLGTLTTVNYVGLVNSVFWVPVAIAEMLWIVYCQRRHVLAARKLALETIMATDVTDEMDDLIDESRRLSEE